MIASIIFHAVNRARAYFINISVMCVLYVDHFLTFASHHYMRCMNVDVDFIWWLFSPNICISGWRWRWWWLWWRFSILKRICVAVGIKCDLWPIAVGVVNLSIPNFRGCLGWIHAFEIELQVWEKHQKTAVTSLCYQFNACDSKTHTPKKWSFCFHRGHFDGIVPSRVCSRGPVIGCTEKRMGIWAMASFDFQAPARH